MKLLIFNFLIFLISLRSSQGLQNGQEAHHSDARYIASIRLRSLEEASRGSGFLCTATLINNWHAITTATCITKFLFSQLQIVLGVDNISVRSSNAVTRDIRRMHFHPSFNRTSESNEFYGNIGIVEFFESIRHSTSRWSIVEYSQFRNFHVQPIRLSDFTLDKSSVCRFFAWGQESNDSEINPHLLTTYLSITDDLECFSSNSIFCANNEHVENPVLCGNLGGALIYDSKLYGIAIKNTCNDIGHFVSIAYYRNWIIAVSGSENHFTSRILNFTILFLIIIINI